uniref:Uncharacterized protein n=1 Tax=Oryza sativa subsp. japonica TaxID=39947 RepID=Q6K7B9_ORYSJ|nr:hypothetical protein [Oryza sativa Japonica Group]
MACRCSGGRWGPSSSSTRWWWWSGGGGVCVEVARGSLESSVVESGEEETVMREKEKGEAMRRKAEEIADAMAAAWEGPGGSSAARLEQFLRCVEASALRASPPPPSKP